VSLGEECDQGDANSDIGECLTMCIISTCGDGVVQPHEQCDDGNDDDTDDCLSICNFSGCGDGYLWAGHEQCDDGNNAPNDGCNALCGVPKRVFQSSAWFTPLMLGSVAGARAKCQAAANAANLGGVWDAWLSDNQSSPSTRFTQSPTGYARIDGVEIAQNWNDLVDGTIDAPIVITEFNVNWGNTEVWTGTTSAGTVGSFHCNEWTTNSNQVRATEGLAGYTSSKWTDLGGNPEVQVTCNGENRIYCFEQ
jgi:cysteine-rich repeat protein